jgi:hypothetical protein
MNSEERREQGLKRVPVQALVEICGRDVGGAPAFEAESLDVSGRGMHLRTAYLPEVGAPLVCRFEGGGNEIVVEGVVAWNREEERGGDFGIQFTALDSGSVEALKELCGLDRPAPIAGEATTPEASAVSEGTRVRLHIDGLGSPMKACVRNGMGKDVQVASNLEFLKVGRHLEIEDVTRGGRRGAQIDGVDVVIDPSTRVPQLVVQLRYDGGTESTPEPSVIDASDEDFEEVAYVPMPQGPAPGAEMGADAPEGAEDEVVEEAAQMRGKLANMAIGAGAAAKRGGAALGSFSTKAAGGMGRLFKGAGAKMMELKQRRALTNAPRRTTAPPPGGGMGAMSKKLRPQSGEADAEFAEPVEVDAGAKKKRIKKYAALGALGVLLITVGVIAMKKPSAPPGADKAKEAAASVAVAANPTDVKQVDEQGNPIAADKSKAPAPGGASAGANAEVPLFGPTPMATMEPAPLGPQAGGDDKNGDSADDAKDEESKEKAAASAAVDDQSFDSDGEKKGDTGPWGRGTMKEPMVYRLRLDKPGKAIQGAVTATGFTVVLPGVKVMESPKGIMHRDARIAKVKTQNGSSGAEIDFQFKDGIPGYRVRLKKDYVEFLVSKSKSDKSDATPSSTGGHKKHHHKKHAASAEKASKKTSGGKKVSKKKHKKSG